MRHAFRTGFVGALFSASLAVSSIHASEIVPSDPDECGLHAYSAEIVRVVDGDTVVADIDLGFHTWRRGEWLRLAGINAPEPRGESREDGRRSTAALVALLDKKSTIVCTLDDARGKYGRYLAWIFVEGPDLGVSVNTHMVRLGFAVAAGDQAAPLEAQVAAKPADDTWRAWALGAHAR